MEEVHVPFDPDFDRSSAPDVFDALGSRNAFLVGLVLSLLVLMSIGFIVLVTVVLR